MKKVFAIGCGIKKFDKSKKHTDTVYSYITMTTKGNRPIIDNFVIVCTEQLSYEGGNKTMSLADINISTLIKCFDTDPSIVSFLKQSEKLHDKMVFTILESNTDATDINEAAFKKAMFPSM